jgi:hypothetical protein
MITREFGDGGWTAGCKDAPPPLHVYDHTNPAANWYPLPRIVLRPQHPGPVMIHIPVVAPYGDDPLDPTAQTVRRVPSHGMVGRLNRPADPRSVRAEGVRL